MALLASEVARIKYELGYNVLDVGAEPYIGVTALFDQVIKPFLSGGATTTSASTIVAADEPTPATLVVADATGISVGEQLVIDVDSLQEKATVRSISGLNVGVLLRKAHSGTYPVTVEGPESLVRSILQRLQYLSGLGVEGGAGGAMGGAIDVAGIKKIDEIEFFETGSWSASQVAKFEKALDYWRDELASVLGVERLNGRASGGGSDMAVY